MANFLSYVVSFLVRNLNVVLSLEGRDLPSPDRLSPFLLVGL